MRVKSCATYALGWVALREYDSRAADDYDPHRGIEASEGSPKSAFHPTRARNRGDCPQPMQESIALVASSA